MTISTETQQFQLSTEETTTSLMFYTHQGLVWGDIVHHEQVLPGRLLTGVSTPDVITLYNAQVMFTETNYIARPVKHKELIFHEHNVLGYHLTPPNEDHLDYDPTEPNRMMTPITAHVGPFLVRAQMRISEQTTVKTNLEVSKAEFVSVYDAEISHPHNQNMAPIKNNLMYVRLKNCLFAAV
jgi:hypothetical protein